MLTTPATELDTQSIANLLEEALGADELKQLARQCGFQKRERKVTPQELLVACISTLGSGEAHWIADIVRTFNKMTGKISSTNHSTIRFQRMSFPIFYFSS